MAVIRHGKQEYPNYEALRDEIIYPQDADEVFLENLGLELNWVQGSTAPHDGVKVFEQTSVADRGRWFASALIKKYYGSGITDAMMNTQSSVIKIEVAGVRKANTNTVVISNGDAFPENVFVVSNTVTEDETVQVVVKNSTGGNVDPFEVNVTVIEL